MTDVLYLSGSEQADLAEPADYVEVVRDGYRERGLGAPAEPRTLLPSPGEPGMMTTYIAILPEAGYMGGYMYAAGFAAADAWFVTPLFDAKRGELIAMLDGARMNPYKTGATGAVGIDALAREDASTLGVIGSGTQARGQVLAATTVREFDDILVYSPTRDNRESFAAAMDERLGPAVRAVDDTADLVPAVDVLITATTASEPVFDGDLLEPGTHITAMGQYNPQKREVDAHTVARSRYVPDLRDRAFSDAGSFLHALETGAVEEDHIHAELGAVVAGEAPGRTDGKQITLFDSGGTAIETVASAGMLYERARERDRGATIELSPASQAFDP